jgi:hypothetical protein
LKWKKSTKSAATNCVEVARVDNTFHVRNSNQPDAGVISFTQGEWDAFTAGVRAGELGSDQL